MRPRSNLRGGTEIRDGVGAFPRKFREFTAKVTVAGRFLVDGAEQIEALRDVVGAQVEHFAYGLGEPLRPGSRSCRGRTPARTRARLRRCSTRSALRSAGPNRRRPRSWPHSGPYRRRNGRPWRDPCRRRRRRVMPGTAVGILNDLAPGQAAVTHRPPTTKRPVVLMKISQSFSSNRPEVPAQGG